MSNFPDVTNASSQVSTSTTSAPPITSSQVNGRSTTSLSTHSLSPELQEVHDLADEIMKELADLRAKDEKTALNSIKQPTDEVLQTANVIMQELARLKTLDATAAAPPPVKNSNDPKSSKPVGDKSKSPVEQKKKPSYSKEPLPVGKKVAIVKEKIDSKSKVAPKTKVLYGTVRRARRTAVESINKQQIVADAGKIKLSPHATDEKVHTVVHRFTTVSNLMENTAVGPTQLPLTKKQATEVYKFITKHRESWKDGDDRLILPKESHLPISIHYFANREEVGSRIMSEINEKLDKIKNLQQELLQKLENEPDKRKRSQLEEKIKNLKVDEKAVLRIKEKVGSLLKELTKEHILIKLQSDENSIAKGDFKTIFSAIDFDTHKFYAYSLSETACDDLDPSNDSDRWMIPSQIDILITDLFPELADDFVMPVLDSSKKTKTGLLQTIRVAPFMENGDLQKALTNSKLKISNTEKNSFYKQLLEKYDALHEQVLIKLR